LADHLHVNPMGIGVLGRPRRVADMPYWPGARKALDAALFAARAQTAWRAVFIGGSALFVSVEMELPSGIKPEDRTKLEGVLRKPPYLVVTAEDHGAGISVVHGVPQRVAPNETEVKLREFAKLLGEPWAVIGSSMDERDTRRWYFWGQI